MIEKRSDTLQNSYMNKDICSTVTDRLFTFNAPEEYFDAEEYWLSLSFMWHLQNSLFHPSRASGLNTQMNTKMNTPWRELEIVNRSWNVSRSPTVENVRIANSQVNPKRLIRPKMLQDVRKMALWVVDSPFFLSLRLMCRISTTEMHTSMMTLNSITAKTGARKAPQKAPTWDKKQLQGKK